MATYVMSDVHGNLTKFIRLMKKIRYNPEEDNLYILGNVIDYGPQPIDLLKVIMSDTSMRMCMGRHEAMMLQAFTTKDFEMLDKWREDYGGSSTYDQYSAEPESEKFRILDYLKNLPMLYSDDRILLVSAGLLINEESEGAEQKKLEEVLEDQVENVFYWIKEEFYTRPALSDRMIFFGATPVQHIRKNNNYKVWQDAVNLDKVCVNTGVNIKPYKLGCVRLEDRKGFYV